MKRLISCSAMIAVLAGFASSAAADFPLFRLFDRDDDRAESRRERVARAREAEHRERAFPGRAWERDRDAWNRDRGASEREVARVQGPQLVPRIDREFQDPLVQIPPAPFDERGLPPVPGPYLGEPLPVPYLGEPIPAPASPLPYSVVPEQLPLLSEMAGPLASGPIELFRRVKYDDTDDAHPRGVKQLVAIRDPRVCRKACDCCGSRLVLVEVCVPPHGCPKVRVSKDAGKVNLDYGEYEVEVEVEGDKIEVEYDE